MKLLAACISIAALLQSARSEEIESRRFGSRPWASRPGSSSASSGQGGMFGISRDPTSLLASLLEGRFGSSNSQGSSSSGAVGGLVGSSRPGGFGILFGNGRPQDFISGGSLQGFRPNGTPGQQIVILDSSASPTSQGSSGFPSISMGGMTFGSNPPQHPSSINSPDGYVLSVDANGVISVSNGGQVISPVTSGPSGTSTAIPITPGITSVIPGSSSSGTQRPVTNPVSGTTNANVDDDPAGSITFAM